MSTPTQSRLRIAADLFQFEDFVDVLRDDVSGYIPKFRAGDDVRIELALFEDGTLLDISNVASLTLEIKPIEAAISEAFDSDEEGNVDLRGPAYDAGLLLTKTVAAVDFYAALDQTEWDSDAADKAHAVFALSAEDTRLAPGDRWLTISLLTTDVPALTRTVCAGRIRVLGGGISHDAPEASTGESFYNTAEADARFLRLSQNLADLSDASAARDNLGLGSAALSDSSDFASAAQGAKADSALQTYQNLDDIDDSVEAFNNIKQLASESATGVVELANASEARALSSATLAMVPARVLDALWNAALYTFRIPVWDTARVTYTLTGSATSIVPEGAYGASVSVASSGSGTAKVLAKLNNSGNWMNNNNSIRLDFSKPIRIGFKFILKSIASAGGTNAFRFKLGETADSVAAIASGDIAIGFSINESGNLTFTYASGSSPVASASLTTFSFSSYVNHLIEVHGNGAGNFAIFADGAQVGSTITGGPNSLTSATAKCLVGLDCSTAPTADTTLGINQWVVFAKQY